jgi:predicted DCC family thiol-disulfide oxidoreductase YuxK
VTIARDARLIYDGDCGFCIRSAQWIGSKWPPGPQVVAWQSLDDPALLAVGLNQQDVTEAAWWIDEDGRLSRGHRAVGKALLRADGAYALIGRLLLAPPFSWTAALAYRLIARFRHRLPGGTPACRI